MVEANGEGGGNNRDATRQRPRVQQLRPTNKDVNTTPAPAVQDTVPNRPTTTASRGEASTSSSSTAAVQPRIVPRIVTGQGSGSTILVNNCQVRGPNLHGKERNR